MDDNTENRKKKKWLNKTERLEVGKKLIEAKQ